MAVKKEDLKKLQMPETYKELGIQTRWAAKKSAGDKLIAFPFYDSRDVQKVLDHVCGPANWTNEPLNINGKTYMNLGINIEGEGWVYKSDVGTESKEDSVKGEASDALKRAASMWGIFRHKYDTDQIFLNTITKNGKKVPCTSNGKPLYGKQVTDYCNRINTGMGNLMSVYKENEQAFKEHPEALENLSALKEFLNGLKQ